MGSSRLQLFTQHGPGGSGVAIHLSGEQGPVRTSDSKRTDLRMGTSASTPRGLKGGSTPNGRRSPALAAALPWRWAVACDEMTTYRYSPQHSYSYTKHSVRTPSLSLILGPEGVVRWLVLLVDAPLFSLFLSFSLASLFALS